MLADEYMFRAILIPFLVLSLAALGVNLLVGYCGQITLGAGAFMAIGAYAAYNFMVRIDGMPLVLAMLLGGVLAAAFGILFGIPSLRVRGLYLAVVTLAAQLLCDWAFLRIGWFTNHSSSGSVSVAKLEMLGWVVASPVEKYLFCLAFVVVFAVIAKNLTRAAIGRLDGDPRQPWRSSTPPSVNCSARKARIVANALASAAARASGVPIPTRETQIPVCIVTP